ncbi:hypothetical protein FBY41_0094 [Humibacillus xanthopallidus]|uniref:Uncharacterized protein n=1 Tax=Humibacillus xanthopallidus TaxID=412689 RepID=A0A543HZK4_9MICO|nr:hypothetical protein FBY41_0094 [Humibacillus xanthopallidus]
MALEAQGPYGNVSTEAWVRPVDHAQDRPIAIPDIVRESLTRAADHAAQATATAAGAASSLATPDGMPAVNKTVTRCLSLSHPDRQSWAR